MKVSVVIPIYNLPKYLRQCVDSVLYQDFDDFEVILVDDGSTDECVAIVEEYAAKDSRVKAIHKENGGMSSARNAGLDIAEGDYVIFLDSDDWWNDQDALTKLYDAAIRNDADVVRGEYRRSSEDGEEYRDGHKLPEERYWNSVMKSFSFLKNVVRKDYFSWLYLLKRTSMKNVRFKETIKYQEDVEFLFHLFTLPLRCIYVPLDFYTYRSRSDSMVRLDSPVKLGYYIEIPFCVYSYGELCDYDDARLYYIRYAITEYQIILTKNLAKSPFYEMRRALVVEFDVAEKNKVVRRWIKEIRNKEFKKFNFLLILPESIGLFVMHHRR